ncbi:MAG: chemotaxis protein CheA [Clostridia bacterium]|nr:chemotaxis protein CheA [Clostridia bacterium]
MDVSQYLDIFLDETKEHLQSLSDQLMILENEPENEDTINEIFRAAHSLKGMAGTMGYKRMQKLTHNMENVFSEVRGGKLKVSSHLIDVLFQALDALEGYQDAIQQTSDEGTNDNEPIIYALTKILEGGNAETPAAQPEKAVNTPAEEQPANDEQTNKKWLNIQLQPSELSNIQEAQKNLNVFGVTVYIQEACILKAARAFLVFKALEELGEIIVSQPSIQDIEDEKFDFDFSMFFSTSADIDKVLAAIKNVSEIQDAFGEPVTAEQIADSKKVNSENGETDKDMAASTELATTDEEKKPEAKSNQAAASAKKTTIAKPVVNRTVRVDIEKLDVLMNLVSELIIAKNSLVSFSESDIANSNFNEQIEYLESVTTNLHESVMKVRMVSIESVLHKFPKMIRELKTKLNKKMELFMSGEETELDRTVVDEIGDPLMHLLRNSADHGIESPEERVKAGKPESGTIHLDAYQDGNNVVIEVRDDGHGIDVAAVKRKAIERGTITAEQGETMGDKDIIDLLFLPSFSTAKVVSDVSGRGVGLDVVKSKIETLGGDVSVKSKLGEGSVFTIRLPLTLAIIQALMVVVGNEKYAISLGSIQTIEDIPEEDVKYVQAKEVINLRGSVIPLIRLNTILGIESTKNKSESMVVVIVKKGESMAGLVVDELIGQQEIVIKSLGKYINCNSRMISGATILGDGEVALILDANAMI